MKDLGESAEAETLISDESHYSLYIVNSGGLDPKSLGQIAIINWLIRSIEG